MSAVALYGAGLPLWASVLLAIVIVALISVVFERIVVRPLLQAGVLAQIVATVGASFVLQTGRHAHLGKERRVSAGVSGWRCGAEGRRGDHHRADAVDRRADAGDRSGSAAVLSQESLWHGGAGLRCGPAGRAASGGLVSGRGDVQFRAGRCHLGARRERSSHLPP